MNYVYGIAILCAIMMFLIVLALYRLHTLDKMQKECDRKVDEAKNKTLSVQEENAKLRTFKYVVESYVTGMRNDEEVRKLIKELLYK
ncbi:MAG: hypothetical protein HFJ50_07325 [Clostridia bacterium]|jgi:hypothetical protein|nr:hypothetical protein [Clostridia bacterium]